MAKTFNAAEIVTLAARKAQVVGAAFSLDKQRLGIGLEYLDMLVAEIIGTGAHFWEAPGPQAIELTAGTASYNIASLLDTPIQFVHRAWVRNSAGSDTPPLHLLNRLEWDAVPDKSQSGVPDSLWIEHSVGLAYPYPVVGTSDTHTLYIDGYGFSRDLTKTSGSVPHDLPTAWQRYLVTRLACDIGDGPLIKAPMGDRDRWMKEAEETYAKLNGYNNRRTRGVFAVRPFMP